MVLNILLLAILFIAGLFNLFYYFPTKKFYAWFQSFFSATKSSTTATKSSLPCNKERNNINKKKLAELRRVFAMFDKNSDGFITKQELRESLKNMRIFMTDKEVEEIVMKADSNGDGLIDFEEFGMLSESMIGHDDHDHDQESTAAHINGNSFKEEEVGFDHELKEAFDVFDKDKDGLISVEELGSILSSMGLNEGNRIENCREMIKKVDMDGDGMVNFEEFKKMMKKSGGNNSATLLLSS